MDQWSYTEIVDFEAIAHCRQVGVVAVLDEESISVDVVQGHELDFSARPGVKSYAAAQIRLAGVRFDAAQARHLASFLSQAADLVDLNDREGNPHDPSTPADPAAGPPRSIP